MAEGTFGAGLTGGDLMDGRIAIVLPRKEGFSRTRFGAIALTVEDYVRNSAYHAQTDIYGLAVEHPRLPGAFHPITPASRWLRSRTTAFAAACADAMRATPPRHIDVHNRVHVFTYLARRFPAACMTLWLHNDPHTMSGARRPAERARLLARAHRVLCVSGWVRHRFLDGIADPAGRVMVMPNALPEFPAPAPDAARQHLILFVGRLTQDKGALIFAEAAARALPFLPGWRAAMIGTGTPDMLAAVRQAVAPVADRVSLPGFIPHADVLAAFAGAAIAVVPSLWDEAFGRTALEAMAAGCALIATRRGGLPEVVGDCGLVLEPPDTATLAAHIAALATDPVRRQDLQRRAAARAAARFAIKPWAAVLDAQRCAQTNQPCG